MISNAKRRQGGDTFKMRWPKAWRHATDLPRSTHSWSILEVGKQSKLGVRLFSDTLPFQATRECWNSSTCGSRRLLVPCSLTAKVCCDKESIWKCRERRHSYKLKLCREGSPTACPGCQDDKVNAEIQAGFSTDSLRFFSANHEAKHGSCFEFPFLQNLTWFGRSLHTLYIFLSPLP